MGNLPITAVDVVVAVVLLGSAGFAFMRGFVHEVLSIGAWVGAFFAALYGFPHARPFFREHIDTAWAADGAAALVLFLASLLILSVLTKALANRVRNSALNSVDSSLGFLFGLVRGAVLLCLAYMLVMWLIRPEPAPDWLAQAKTRPWLDRGAEFLQELAPAELGLTESAARGLSAEARRAMELEKTYRSLTAPQPSAEPGKADKVTGYDQRQIMEMNRLIQNNQQQ